MDGAARIALLESEVEQLSAPRCRAHAELAARERRIRLLEEALTGTEGRSLRGEPREAQRRARSGRALQRSGGDRSS